METYIEEITELISSNTFIKIIVAYLLIVLCINIICRLRRGKDLGNYRSNFIKVHPGKRRFGKRGYWYRCANCGKWCGRPGSDNVYIRDDEKMEVDHIRPWSQGGTDAVWNLQPLCKPCNRSKSNKITVKDKIKTVGNTIVHPVDNLIAAPIRKSGRNNKVLKKIGITKRK